MKIKKHSANNASYSIIGDYRLPKSYGYAYASLSEIRRSIFGSVFYRFAELIRDNGYVSPYQLNKMSLNTLIRTAKLLIKLQEPRHRPPGELRINKLCSLLLDLIPKIQSQVQLADWQIVSCLHNGLSLESESSFNDELKTQLKEVEELITIMRSERFHYLYTRYMTLIGTPIKQYKELSERQEHGKARRRLNEFRKNLHEQAIGVNELQTIREEAINSIANPENFAYINLLFKGLKKSEQP